MKQIQSTKESETCQSTLSSKHYVYFLFVTSRRLSYTIREKSHPAINDTYELFITYADIHCLQYTPCYLLNMCTLCIALTFYDCSVDSVYRCIKRQYIFCHASPLKNSRAMLAPPLFAVKLPWFLPLRKLM